MMNNTSAFSFDAVSSVLTRSLIIYRDNFIPFIALVAIITIPLTIVTNALSRPVVVTQEIPTLTGSDILLFIVVLLGGFLQGVVINGLITYVTSENVFGRQITLIEAFNEAQHRLVPLALGLLLFGIVFTMSVTLVFIAGILCLIPLLLMPVLAYFWLATYFYIVPVLVLEKVGVQIGITRALKLGKSRFWTTFALFFVLTLITFFVSSIFGGLAQFISGDPLDATTLQFDPVYTLANMIVTVLVAPLLPIGFTVIYYDTRNQTEDLDGALQASGQPDARPADVISPVPQDRLVSMADLNNVLLFTALVIGLTVVLSILGISLLDILI